jgi:uncharacterized protein (TIGR03663 family)
MREAALPQRARLSAARLVDVWNAERLAYAGVFVTALVLRLIDLSAKPLHHDESVHAWFSWVLFTTGNYEYDPVYHGPVQFYLGALMYAIAGVGDFAIRLAPALLGSAITVLPYLLRRQLGPAGALATSVALCLSPAYLYYSRFAREDIYAAFVTFVLVVVVFRFLERPRPWHPACILGLVAVSFATKETTYILVFVGGTFFIAATAYQVLRSRPRGGGIRDAPIVAAVTSVGRDAWIWGAATFALVYTLLFTTFLLEPQGLRTGLYESISYWLSQQPVNRGDQPWFYYLVVLPAYELPVVILAAVGLVATLKRPTLFRLFLVWHAGVSLAVYSWASERMPWLTLHLLLPIVLLAGIGFQVLWARQSLARAAAGALAAAGAAFLLYGGIQATYVHPADPAELLVFTQTSPEVLPVRDEIVAAGDMNPPLSIHVDQWGGLGWPWGWYLRDVPVFYQDMSDRKYVPDADVVAVAHDNRERVLPALDGYRGRRFHMREWWVVDYESATPRDALRWFFRREAWSVKGTIDAWLYVRETSRTGASSGSG